MGLSPDMPPGKVPNAPPFMSRPWRPAPFLCGLCGCHVDFWTAHAVWHRDRGDPAPFRYDLDAPGPTA